jgi:ABC-type cobalamin/Fe3+-siderophores transport system ATPase subunit
MNADGVENPFCTRRIRPGAMPFLFSGDASAETLVARLRANNWRGQIVGPHGSGKSALLAALIPAVERAGQQVLSLELHDGQRALPHDFWRGPQLASCTLLIVDGYEQLGRWACFRLRRFCRRPRLCRAGFQPDQDELETRPTGLLVTAHAPVGLPELCRTAADLDLACRLVSQLQRDHQMLVTAQDVVERFPRHGGNLRELLFDLYDLYERRQRAN